MRFRKLDIKRIFFACAFVIALLWMCLCTGPSFVSATSFDRIAICNLEGQPGETVAVEIKLKGDGTEVRTGYWKTYYREEEGDGADMDITGWIDIQPVEYTIKPGETIVFTINIHIPENAAPGLYGAATQEAGLQGHVAERRSYITFRDTPEGGNTYSGMMIPISVQVAGSPGLFSSFFNFISTHLTYTIMAVIIIILAILLLTGRKSVVKQDKTEQ